MTGAEGTPRVTALASAPPSRSPSLRGHQGTAGLFPAPSLPPPSARPRSLLSARSRLGFSGMLLLPMVWDVSGSSPPLAVLPFGLGFGAWQNLGLGWWGLMAIRLSGGQLAVTPVTLRRVLGEGGRRAPAANRAPCSASSRRTPGSCSSGCRGRAGLSDIPGFSSQPLTPLSAALKKRGCFVPPSPWKCSLLDGGFGSSWGWGIPIFRISQLFPFFPAAFLIRLGAAYPAGATLTPTAVLRWPLPPPGAFAACPGLSPSCFPLPGCLQLPTQAPLLWKRCFGAAGCTNANTARATAGKLEASQECFQVQVFLRCPGSAQNRDQQCLHEHWDAAHRIPAFSFLLFSPNIK